MIWGGPVGHAGYLGKLNGAVNVFVDHFLRPDQVIPLFGAIYCGSLSGLLARMERERRREDAIAAFAPELLEAA